LQIVTEKTEKYKPMMQTVIIVNFHDVTKNEKQRQQGHLKYHVTFKCHFNANKGKSTATQQHKMRLEKFR